MFFWRERQANLELAFTDRHGGVSASPFDSLNLGGHVGDDPEAVATNRSRLAHALGVARTALVVMDQRHGSEVAVVHEPPVAPPVADALVTSRRDLALVVLVADCTPVLLWDDSSGLIAAAHAGRPGMTSGVIGRTVEVMRAHGARRLRAVAGPSVCGRCYEVPAQMRADAALVCPEAQTVSWTGTPAIDVAAGVVAQLAALDVQTQWVPGCAREDDRLFSHRRSGVTGRFAGVIVAHS